ncbi:TetR/AcrR family transcriptional regulator [Nocardia pseudobrasiliensis]|uniref:TetR family transcriptional regulator n=1 Tax=Nocardia pseudobrasiliensis TaxID=45979 RepID=A0A370IEB5_9NOCA|nr:TetR/AcrR family transcriptional regulator [Nocardia pseudobrasiliensis]RDI69067.1 TetR family transcriptional regulator [Nocardia pseudobrasiliensis]
MVEAAQGSERDDGRTRSVWLRPTSPGRTEPPITRARIVEAAVALLDEEGLERLTMRRLAQRLGTGSTTLYWHLDTKDDVIDLAVDAIFGETPIPERHSDDWRADLTALLTGWRATLLRHPWTAGLAANRRPLLGPNFLAWMEFLRAALVRAGFVGPHVSAASWALVSHVAGSAASESSLRLSEEDFRAADELVTSQADRFPALAEHGYLSGSDWTANFDHGLTYLLDGLAVQLQRRD